MKKFFLYTILLVVLFFCCSCTTKTDDVTEVVFWHQYKGGQLEILNEQIRNFNMTYGKQNNIYVKGVKFFSAERIYKQLLASCENELSLIKHPNIATVYPDAAYKLNNLDLISSLNTHLTDDDIDSYVDEFIEEGKIFDDENIYLLPIAKSSEVLYINKTAYDRFLSEYNASNIVNSLSYDMLETFEGILYSAEKYYEFTDGKALFGMDSPFNFEILASFQNGIDIFSSNELLDENSEIYDIFFTYYYEPMIIGYFAAYSNYRADDLKSRDILMYTGSTGGASFFPSSVNYPDGLKEDIELKVLPYPYMKDGFECCIQQGPGMIMLNSSQEKMQASMVFLKWITNEENNTRFVQNSGYLPANNASFYKQSKSISDKNNISNVMEITMDSFEQGAFYSYTPNEYSEDIRITLEDVMVSKIESARKDFLKYIKDGHGFDEALDVYLNNSVYKEIVSEAIDEISEIYKK